MYTIPFQHEVICESVFSTVSSWSCYILTYKSCEQRIFYARAQEIRACLCQKLSWEVQVI